MAVLQFGLQTTVCLQSKCPIHGFFTINCSVNEIKASKTRFCAASPKLVSQNFAPRPNVPFGMGGHRFYPIFVVFPLKQKTLTFVKSLYCLRFGRDCHLTMLGVGHKGWPYNRLKPWSTMLPNYFLFPDVKRQLLPF